MASILRQGARFVGQGGKPYALASPLGHRSGTLANVWKAADANDPGNQFVLKHPSFEGSISESRLTFQKEMEMQKTFQSSYFIRRMVDIIPSQNDTTSTMMVLEPFEKTLWTARTRRRFTMKEIKHVMKPALLGLNEVHEKGYVYCERASEWIRRQETPTSDEESVDADIQVKLADLGSVMRPNRGAVTSITYRSPEAYLGKPWTGATDIWSWGIVLFHLIQARIDFDSPGIYDSILKGASFKEKEDAVLAAMCEDFELHSVEYFKDCNLPPAKEGPKKERPKESEEEEIEGWADKLAAGGVPLFDIAFLYGVLQPDPNERMTVAQILETGYLDVYKNEEP